MTAFPFTTPDALLSGYDYPQQRLHFALVDRATYHQSAFLDHRIQPMPQQIRSITVAEARQLLNKLTLSQPRCYILHTAFCASTFLAKLFDAANHTLVLREPKVLSTLADHLRATNNHLDPEFCSLILRLQMRCYAKQQRVVVKPSNFANRIATTFPADTQGEYRQVLLSNSLEAFLVSVMKKHREAQQLLPHFLASLLSDTDYRSHFPQIDLNAVSLAQQAVVLWHCQRYYFDRLSAQWDKQSYVRISQEQLLSEPLETLATINRLFTLNLSTNDIEQLATSKAAFTDAKQGGTFSADRYERDYQATLQLHQPAIHQALKWADTLLHQLPVT